MSAIHQSQMKKLYGIRFNHISLPRLHVPAAHASPARILLISDSHIARSAPPSVAVRLFLNALKGLITAESATHICHLGDLVDIRIGDDAHGVLAEIFDEIEKWQIPFWAIGGNHDRGFFEMLPESNRQFVHFSTAECMELQLPGSNAPRLFLGHELGHPYHIRDQHAIPFLDWLKVGFCDVFKKEDWLLTGHCHTTALSRRTHVGCVGQFSPEKRANGYGVLDIGEVVYLELKNGPHLLTARI
jgi:predicted phosphodiesterase